MCDLRVAARERSDIWIEEKLVEEDTDGREWLYRLIFNQDKQRVPTIKEERVECDGKEVLSRPDDQDEADPPRLTQTALEQITAGCGE